MPPPSKKKRREQHAAPEKSEVKTEEVEEELPALSQGVLEEICTHLSMLDRSTLMQTNGRLLRAALLAGHWPFENIYFRWGNKCTISLDRGPVMSFDSNDGFASDQTMRGLLKHATCQCNFLIIFNEYTRIPELLSLLSTFRFERFPSIQIFQQQAADDLINQDFISRMFEGRELKHKLAFTLVMRSTNAPLARANLRTLADRHPITVQERVRPLLANQESIMDDDTFKYLVLKYCNVELETPNALSARGVMEAYADYVHLPGRHYEDDVKAHHSHIFRVKVPLAWQAELQALQPPGSKQKVTTQPHWLEFHYFFPGAHPCSGHAYEFKMRREFDCSGNEYLYVWCTHDLRKTWETMTYH